MAQEYLKPGTKAPAFQSKDQDGTPVSLSQFAGRKVVLYFYPKDDTPGCTKQACNLAENFNTLTDRGIVVLGVSVDDEASHRKFIKKFNLPFPLLSDTDHSVVEAYKAWGEKSMYGKKYMGTHRVTYVIDEKGMISHVIAKPEVSNHAAQILDLLGN